MLFITYILIKHLLKTHHSTTLVNALANAHTQSHIHYSCQQRGYTKYKATHKTMTHNAITVIINPYTNQPMSICNVLPYSNSYIKI